MPLIHNVMNTDLVIGVSDQATDGLNAVFNTDAGRAYLARRLGVAPELVRALGYFGLSSIANVLGAIKMAKHCRPRPRRRRSSRWRPTGTRCTQASCSATSSAATTRAS